MEKDEKYILALDEGTTSARAIIIDKNGDIRGFGQYKFQQHYPKPGWVEHDPHEIWKTQKKAMKTALDNAGIKPRKIASIGITNQRETMVLWDKDSGQPVHKAIVWQDRRTAEMVDKLDEEHGSLIRKRTGLIPDAYFSGPKISWLLENTPSLRKKAKDGRILFGTIDSYLIYRLTGGRVHVSDFTNTSRTMTFDIHKLRWDDDLLEILNIPRDILPEPVESSKIYGYTDEDTFGGEVPISGSAGDQQAALFGQTCFETGMVKNTCGTGSFVLMNTGRKPCKSEKLLTTIGWSLEGQVNYALEGSVFIAGAGIEWLENSLKLLESAEEAEPLANSLSTNDGVYFVPAFVGLGAPYWDQYARGMIVGITRGTKKANLARSALEAIGYFTKDILDEMEKDMGIQVKKIRIDGGAAKNDFLMKFLSNILGDKVIRPEILETTALGAAYLSGLAIDYWKSPKELTNLWIKDREYEPDMGEKERKMLYSGWKKAVGRSLGWAKELREAGWKLEN